MMDEQAVALLNTSPVLTDTVSESSCPRDVIDQTVPEDSTFESDGG